MVLFDLCQIIDSDPLFDPSVYVGNIPLTLRLPLLYLLPKRITIYFLPSKLHRILENRALYLTFSLVSAKSL